MRFLITILAAGIVFAPSLRADDTNRPVLTIYRFVGGPARAGEVPYPIIAALWKDGRIVWSESHIQGGPPYLQGQFAPSQLASLLDKLEGRGVFTNAALARVYFGPDASYTTIAIAEGNRRLRMRSWHELYEQNTNVVATAAGLTSLRGQQRNDVLRQQPLEFRQFRQTWSELREAVDTLIPKNGEAFAGEIPLPDERP